MTDQHPITPPPELVQEWINEEDGLTAGHIATQAARWGYQQCMKLDAAWLEAKLQKARDQELEACIAWMMQMGYWGEDGRAIPALRAARRPKPPSLKEQALAALSRLNSGALCANPIVDKDTIRRALETLPDSK